MYRAPDGPASHRKTERLRERLTVLSAALISRGMEEFLVFYPSSDRSKYCVGVPPLFVAFIVGTLNTLLDAPRPVDIPPCPRQAAVVHIVES